MAVLTVPGFLSLRFSRNHNSLPRRNVCRCSFSATENKKSSAIIWFKHDLRLDDHPGLLAASKYKAVLPLYVFDHRILSRYSDEMLELVLFALEDLRNSLKRQGSNLMIRFGSVENVIKKLVEEVQASNVFAEEEIEYELLSMMNVIKESLREVRFPGEAPRVTHWQTPFYEIKNLKDLPGSYDDFKKLKLPPTSPILPSVLPGAGMELDWGSLPTFDDVKDFTKESSNKPNDSWTAVKEMSAETILNDRISKSRERKTYNSVQRTTKRMRPNNSVFVTSSVSIVAGGTDSVLNALAAYLRYLEGTARDDWQEVHEMQRDAESREGSSFLTLFGPAIHLGIISRRRVHYEAIKYEKERNAGFVSPFGYSVFTVTASIDAVCSMEWYWLMALKSQISDAGRFSIRIWRWKGHLIQYTVAGHDGPAVLLVHGFGAFLEHYRDNIFGIAKDGRRVWALSVLGFGKSEKPNIVYTEIMWAELLRDFVIEVIGEPVHLVGNSIGGYFVALSACFWPALAKSVVLVNSAGNVIPGTFSPQISRERRVSGTAWLGARLLLFYLRSNIKSLVRKCYPTRTDRADDWLIAEMLRASHDPGVVIVLESIFSFDLSIPLNHLLEQFKGKVLIVQGMKDSIADSKSKVTMLREHCTGVVIKELNAGHCPHDELPEEVNSIICEWVAADVQNKLPAHNAV